MRLPLVTWLLAALLLSGCAASRPDTDPFAGDDIVLLGEQHDDPAHQERQRDLVRSLAARERLAAVALEMAEQGRSTAGLPRTAGEGDVRAALGWNERAWPWRAYGPAVMAAVAAGVPVLGANLPRDRMRQAMADATLDQALDAKALEAQREAIRAGHCGLLPSQQIGPMVRVQVARDRAMASTLAAAAVPGKSVVLIAGAGHVDPAIGVPRHLPASLRVRPEVLQRSTMAPVRDYCAELRQQLQRKP